jgi:DNA-binding NarL/FixJ family response regulator
MLETNVSGLCPNFGKPTGAKIRIAIADDHPIFSDGLRRLLCLEEDLEVVAQVNDGQHVAEALQKCGPDILLLDLNMPGLSGLGTLKLLQAASSRTRVILLTASDNRHAFIEALKLGSCGIVQKQAATDLLIEAIRRVFAGEIWLDSDTTAAVVHRCVADEQTIQPHIHATAFSREREHSQLSPRETELVSYVAQGFKNKDIGERMYISEQTVKNHLHSIFDKLHVSDRLELGLHFISQ